MHYENKRWNTNNTATIKYIIDNYGENWIRVQWNSDDVIDALAEFAEQQLKILNIPDVVAEPLDIDKLIESLGEPSKGNEFIISPDENGEWWIEHKVVGSGEPLRQFINGFKTKTNDKKKMQPKTQ